MNIEQAERALDMMRKLVNDEKAAERLSATMNRVVLDSEYSLRNNRNKVLREEDEVLLNALALNQEDLVIEKEMLRRLNVNMLIKFAFLVLRQDEAKDEVER